MTTAALVTATSTNELKIIYSITQINRNTTINGIKVGDKDKNDSGQEEEEEEK